jgi:hypothetical protein
MDNIKKTYVISYINNLFNLYNERVKEYDLGFISGVINITYQLDIIDFEDYLYFIEKINKLMINENTRTN